MLNKNIALIAMGALAAMSVEAQDAQTASAPQAPAAAPAQDTHLQLTRQVAECLTGIIDSLSKAKSAEDAAKSAQVIRDANKKLMDLGKRQMALPPITLEEQKELNEVFMQMDAAQRMLINQLNRLQSEKLLSQDILMALMEMQNMQDELDRANDKNIRNAAPLAKDAEGNTHETLLADIIEGMETLLYALQDVTDEQSGDRAVEAVETYRKQMIEIAKKQAALPPLDAAQQANLKTISKDAVEVSRALGEVCLKLSNDAKSGAKLKAKLKELSDTIRSLQTALKPAGR